MFPDQPVPGRKLLPSNTQKLTTICGKQTPVEKFSEIKSAAENIGQEETNQAYLREFSVAVNAKPILVPGRILQNPEIQSSGHNIFVHHPVAIKRWCLINVSRHRFTQREIDEFVRRLLQNAKSLSIHLAEPSISCLERPSRDIAGIFADCLADIEDLQIIMFIIEDTYQTNESDYHKIKMQGK